MSLSQSSVTRFILEKRMSSICISPLWSRLQGLTPSSWQGSYQPSHWLNAPSVSLSLNNDFPI